MRFFSLFIISVIFLLLLTFQTAAQNQKEISKYTRNEILSMSYEELLNFSLEDIIILSDIVGVDSANELLELILNTEIITVSKRAEKLGDAPASVVVISQKQIKEYGWNDLKDVFRAIPSFDLSYNTQGELGTSVQIRGVQGNQKILVLQDGKRISPITGEVFIYSYNIPLQFYKQIEIVYGPASALYGADAYAGVINLITKDSEDINGVETDYRWISTNAHSASVCFGKKINKHSDFTISVRHIRGEDFAFHEYYDSKNDYGAVKEYTGNLAEKSKKYPINNWNVLAKYKINKITLGFNMMHTYESNALGTPP